MNDGEVRCAKCGSSLQVAWVTPDMDIPAVPLCLICRWERPVGSGTEDRP